MAKLAFIILGHNDPDNLFRLVERLTLEGDLAVVHWDKKNPFDLQAAANKRLQKKSLSSLRFSERVAVEWGRWSMVEATLACIKTLAQAKEKIDYVILLSGTDYPIKSIASLKAFLKQNVDKEYIECVDPDVDPWVVQGLVKERFLHHHWFNWRDNPKLFDWSLTTQKRLGLKRKLPNGLKPYFGSQWWALTWKTLQQVLAISERGPVKRFFKTTWVPDEMFFQTLVKSVVPHDKIVSSGLTFYHFTHQGKPLIFYNDHFNFLSQQNYFFARKLSPEASGLRDQLDAHSAKHKNIAISHVNKQLASYQHFISVQWRGMPDRRVVGRQLDPWYGDLEWNKKPYFAILCCQNVRLEALREALNALPKVCCYRELFHGGHIDYGKNGKEHPLYPASKPKLRDMKRPNFLVDMIRANGDKVIGFVLRLPCGNEMEKMVIFDPQATVIFVLPSDDYLPAPDNNLNWQAAFDNMIMYDYLAELQRARKNITVLKARNHSIPPEGIKAALDAIRPLPATVAN